MRVRASLIAASAVMLALGCGFNYNYMHIPRKADMEKERRRRAEARREAKSRPKRRKVASKPKPTPVKPKPKRRKAAPAEPAERKQAPRQKTTADYTFEGVNVLPYLVTEDRWTAAEASPEKVARGRRKMVKTYMNEHLFEATGAHTQKRWQEAAQLFEKSAQYEAASDYPSAACWSNSVRMAAELHVYLKNYAKGIALYSVLRSYDKEHAHWESMVKTSQTMAEAYLSWGKYQKAIDEWRFVLSFFDVAKMPPKLEAINKAACYKSFGVIYQEWGKYDEARKSWSKALDLYKKAGNQNEIKKVRGYLEKLKKKR